MNRRVVDRMISAKYREGIEYSCDLLLGMRHSYIKDGFITLITDVVIDKYLIGIQLLSICIRVDLCPTTSIGTCMERCERKLQGLKLNRIWTQIE